MRENSSVQPVSAPQFAISPTEPGISGFIPGKVPAMPCSSLSPPPVAVFSYFRLENGMYALLVLLALVMGKGGQVHLVLALRGTTRGAAEGGGAEGGVGGGRGWRIESMAVWGWWM
jgi:hypothetical protein